MSKRLVLAGVAATAFCVSSLPAHAAGGSRSGSNACIATISACSVSGSHSATSFTNWCTVANNVYASCQFSHACSATAYGTLVTGSLTCSFATPATVTCTTGTTAGQCSMNRTGTTIVTTSNCATFTVDARATSPVGGSAQWTHGIIMCVDPNTGPYVLANP